MEKPDRFSSMFEKKKGQRQENAKSPAFRSLDVTQQSLAIVKAIDKLKAQGIPITKKAEMDYLLARQVLGKAHIIQPSPGPAVSKPKAAGFTGEESSVETPMSASKSPLKRNPKDNPEEFEMAMEISRTTVIEVEELIKIGKPVPIKKMETYELCKKFLEKYT